MKMWGGRFSKPTDKIVEQFTASLPIDCRLFREDIEGSLAHAKMLGAVGIITEDEAEKIRAGLLEIMGELEGGNLAIDSGDEDIHMVVERALIDKIGPIGGKLHAARSRNDQVATDMRLYLKRALKEIAGRLAELAAALLELAEANQATVMPGYTHLQRAQPVFLAHHLLAYLAMFRRDQQRLIDCFAAADVLPLGSAALAGTSLPIDREMVAKELGFSKISDNSMDSVSDRDWLVQFLAAAATIMVHLSRLSEEMVLWSSAEFAFIELDDAFTTGSSIMPQKKNPDVAELIRGKSGRVFGDLMAMLTVLKGLPLTYHRDLQEDKTFMFDAVDTLNGCLQAMAGMVAGAEIKTSRMAVVAGDFATATDFADYLVKKGVPFRSAHETVGKLVKWCLDENKFLSHLTLDDFKRFDSRFEADCLGLADPSASAAAKTSPGGTGSESIAAQIAAAKDGLVEIKRWISEA